MKQYDAMVLRQDGDSVKFVKETRELPALVPGEVTVKIKNCGVCGSDISRWRGGAYFYPIVIGHEFSGVVEYDPEGKLNGLRAAIFPILPCHECEPCSEELYAMCNHYDYYGSRRDGAFATHLNVKKENLVPIPENVSDEEAAMCEPAAVALNAMKKPRSIKGRAVAVYGAGTIGILLIKLAKIYGASHIYCSDPDAVKLAFACECGATPLNEAKENALPDVFFDACGHPSALMDMLNRAKPLSEIVLVGNPSMDVTIEKTVYWKILRKEIALYGTWNSRMSNSRNDWAEVLGYLADGSLTMKELITHRYSLYDAEDALQTLSAHKEFCEKVMLCMD